MSQFVKTFALLFFILIPLDGVIAFLSVYLDMEILLAWEMLLGVLVIYLAGIHFILRKKIREISIDFSLDILVLILFFVISSLVGFINQGVKQTLWGVKTILIPFFILLPLFLIAPEEFEKFTKKVVNGYVILYIPILVIAFMEIFFGLDLLRDFTLHYDRPLVKVVTMEGIFRSIATFREPYEFGFFALIISIFSLCRLVTTKGKKVFHLFFVILGILGLIVSTSRTNIISFIYILLALSMIVLFFRFIKSETAKLVSLIGTASFIILSVLIVYKYSIAFPGELHLLSAQSLEERTFLWNDAIINFPINRPQHLLLGYGIGAVGAPQLKVNSLFYNPIDNIYLFFIISFGVVGTILILLPIFISMVKIFERFKKQNWIQLSCVLILAALFFMQGFFVTFAEGLLSWSVCWLAVFYLRSSLLSDRIK